MRPTKLRRRILKILIDALGYKGALIVFLRQVYSASPCRKDLQRWLLQNFPDVVDRSDTAPEIAFQRKIKPSHAVMDGLAGGLQRYVRLALGDVDILVWLASRLDVARRVCCVKRNFNALGTGFLVGPDVVLTNWHVVMDLVSTNLTGDLAFRFDFAAAPGGGTKNGDQVDVASKGIFAWSSAAASEMPMPLG